jgi:CBS domain-containing protein
MRIAEVYRPGPTVCRPRETIAAAAQRILAHGIDALGVCAGGRPLGVISERNVVRAVADGADPHTTAVDAYVRWGAYAASPDEDTATVARRMVELAIRRMPVLRGTSVIGMVSLADTAEALERMADGTYGRRERATSTFPSNG